jgi:hypothetical protein
MREREGLNANFVNSCNSYIDTVPIYARFLKLAGGTQSV